ncbi:putative acetyltransferase [Microbacterium oleivorans]|uniref:putative acetyltransferase n=1 Tax=Microbacterium oleivorans TaxID=273677 RepID=UPI00203A6030|nr:hypothetical protein [Microbacterium oleivorans]MCM3696319.1 hypothetical protein [Microbacterium oleivorans]
MVIAFPVPGTRVVVRYLLPDGQATDALGELVTVEPDVIVVDGRRGLERIGRATVIAAKAVPPPPEPRARRGTA